MPVHLKTKVRDRLRGCLPEDVNCFAVKVVWQPPQSLFLPFLRNALYVERRELSLKLCDNREVELFGFTGRATPQDGLCLARVVVAVMAKEHDASAHLRLQPALGSNLGNEKMSGEEPAGLLAKSNDRLDAHAARPGSAGAQGPKTVCSSTPKGMQAPQTIDMYPSRHM